MKTLLPNPKFFSLALALAVSAVGLVGCGGDDNDNNTAQTVYGASQKLGDGTVRSYVTTMAGVPQAIGVEFTEAALQNEPPGPAPINAIEYKLDPPANLNATPFQSVSIYYTQGHEPAAQFGSVPHFHPIFSLNTNAYRDQIALDFNPSDPPVAAAETPQDHISTHFTLPRIGTVYLDPSNPKVSEVPFHSFDMDFAFFNGHMNSHNLTIASSWLAQKQSASVNFKIPQKYPKPGYYPTRYTITYDANRKVYNAALVDFVSRS
jgi:hypothetical protein